MMTNTILYYQASLFDLFGDDLSLVPKNAEKTTNSNYLDRETRILSLAKEKYKRVLTSYQFSDIEEKIYSVKIGEKDTIKTIVGKITRIFRKYLDDFSTDKGKLLETLIPYNIQIKIANLEETEHFRYLKKDNSDKILKLILSEKGYPDLIVYGAMKSNPHKKFANTLYKNEVYSHSADLAKKLAWMFVIGNVNMSIANNPCMRIRLRETYDSIEQLKGVIYRRTKNFDETSPNHFELSYALKDTPIETTLKCLYPNGSFIFSNQIYKKGMLEHSIPNLVTIRSYEGIINHIPVNLMTEMLPYHAFLTSYQKKESLDFWPIPTDYSNYGTLFDCLEESVKQVWKARGNELSFTNELKVSSADYAKSYQTKKHIPNKVLQAMEKSGFNKYFGYVEFDQDVDLNKVEEIQKEFSAFMDSFFSGIDISDNAMRIRKLGNHKASGLYYPGVKCLCIDITSPKSMIHEFGHLLDYQLGEKGNISLNANFNFIIAEYKERLVNSGAQNSTIQAQLDSKGKYNLNYYLRPTEVFARSFELYCKHSLGVRNSLLEPIGFAYPNDEVFLSIIEDYFNEIFNKKNKKGESAQ